MWEMTIVHHRPYNGVRRRSLFQTSGGAETGASVDFPNALKGFLDVALFGPYLHPVLIRGSQEVETSDILPN